jgi:hypothetical protein
MRARASKCPDVTRRALFQLRNPTSRAHPHTAARVTARSFTMPAVAPTRHAHVALRSPAPRARALARHTTRAASHRRAPRTAALDVHSAESLGIDGGAYARELEVALDAVRMASTLCQEVQAQLMRMDEQAETKEDRSLVTLADYAAQAIISWCVAPSRMSVESDARVIVSVLLRLIVCD